MQLQKSFTVPVPVEEAWDLFLDVERIVPAMPGASLTSFEGNAFTGQVKVKIGAIQMAYKGQGEFTERDEAARRLVMTASGKDAKGAGTVAATITSTLTDVDGSTRVDVVTDLALTGKPAQFGRSLLNDVSSKIIDQFAANLSAALKAPEPAVAEDAVADSAVSAVSADSADSADSAGPVVSAGPAVKAIPQAEPLDLVGVAGKAVAKRVAVGVAAVVGAAVVLRLLRKLFS